MRVICLLIALPRSRYMFYFLIFSFFLTLLDSLIPVAQFENPCYTKQRVTEAYLVEELEQNGLFGRHIHVFQSKVRLTIQNQKHFSGHHNCSLVVWLGFLQQRKK